MSSPNKSKVSLKAGIIETKCYPFLAFFAKDCELNSFITCTALLLTVLSLEIVSI